MNYLVQTDLFNVPAQDYGYAVMRAVDEFKKCGKDSPSFMWGRNCHTFQIAQTCESSTLNDRRW